MPEPTLPDCPICSGSPMICTVHGKYSIKCSNKRDPDACPVVVETRDYDDCQDARNAWISACRAAETKADEMYSDPPEEALPEPTAYVPEYEIDCSVCGQTPVVTITDANTGDLKHNIGLCGPCCFGEAAMLEPARWNK